MKIKTADLTDAALEWAVDVARTGRANLALPEYQIDPIDPNNPGPWDDLHQAMHQQFDELLGIAGFNLIEVDWKNEGERAAWIWLNAQEHYQAAQILGLG